MGKGASAVFENIGFTELLVILGAALVIFGPSKLPELGKSLGQGIREFKKATQTITEEVTRAAADQVSPSQPETHIDPTTSKGG